MENKAEIPLWIVCDTNKYNNKLNKFRQDLAYELKFSEDYSMGLSSISMPNSLLNIREDAILNFGFFKETKMEDNGVVFMVHDDIDYTLHCSFSVHVKKGVYITHKQFTDGVLKSFINTNYPANMTKPNIFTYLYYKSLGVLTKTDMGFIMNLMSQKVNELIANFNTLNHNFINLKKKLF